MLYFLPIVAGTLFQQFYNAVDAIIVGKFVGTEALAAVSGSASSFVNLAVAIFVALSGGAAVVIAQLYGARDEDGISKASHTALAFCVLLGLVLSAVLIAASKPVMEALRVPPDTLEGAVLYLRIYFAGTVFSLVFNMGSSILRAVGDSKHPFVYLVVCCACNIVLDLVLVLWFSLGVAGVAIATVISQAISAVLVTARLCRGDEIYSVRLSKLRIDPLMLRRMMLIGIPSGLQSSMYGVSNLILQSAVNLLGTVAVASWGLSGKVDGFYWATANAMGIAITNFIGQNYGAGKRDRITGCIKKSLAICLPATAAISAVILTLGIRLLWLFTDDASVVETTTVVIRFFVPFYVTWTLIEIFAGTLRGLGDTFVPVIIQAVGICAFRLVWVFTVFGVWQTLPVICLGYPLSWIVTDIALMIYYFGFSRMSRRKLFPNAQVSDPSNSRRPRSS